MGSNRDTDPSKSHEQCVDPLSAAEAFAPDWQPSSKTGQYLKDLFDRLWDHFGPQHWWPGETDLEVMAGAILTQNTNWKNVEKAIGNLKRRDLLSVEGLHGLPMAELAQEIRPAGYFNVKAKRLKNLIRFVVEDHQGDLSLLFGQALGTLRQGLLSVTGVGPETADSIILYGARLPVFVIDAYTYRILSRHGLVEAETSYDDLQSLFMDHLPEDAQLFNEFHALMVMAGKHYCRRVPLCKSCPLQGWGPVPVSI